jgi:nucleoside 2-deoxyribosyltransferase
MSCPICRIESKHAASRSLGGWLEIKCERCGMYHISFSAKAVAEQGEPDYRLSAWLRSHSENSDPPKLDSDSLAQIAKSLPTYGVAAKQLFLMRALEERTEFAGKKVHIVQNFDFPLAWCSSVEELNYIIRALNGRDLLSLDKVADPQDSFSLDITITPRGWDYLDSSAKVSPIKDQAFVAMAFAPSLRPAWEVGIREALARAGYKAYRVDADEHLERIDAKLITEIKNSRFVVADVTLQRPGVYFEAGFAIGIGLPVVWSVRKDDLPNVHFDTRQYNHVVWETESDLAHQMYFRVIAAIGRGTAA